MGLLGLCLGRLISSNPGKPEARTNSFYWDLNSCHLFEKLQTHLLYIKFLKYLLVLSVSRKQTAYFAILQFEN